MSRASRGTRALTPPVLGGVVGIGNSPVITPGVWSRNGTDRLYSLQRNGVIVPALARKPKAELESYLYVTADQNTPISIVEHALDGGDTSPSNSLIGYIYSAVALLTTSNKYTAPGTDVGVPDGSATFTMAIGWRKITPVGDVMVNQNFIDRYSSAGGGGGFRMNILDSNNSVGTTRLIAYGYSSAPAAAFTSSSHAIGVSPAQNQIQRTVMTIDGTTLSNYRNRALVASIALSGFTPATTAKEFIIATLSGSTDEFELVYVSISETHAMTAGEVTTYDNIVTAHGSRRVTSCDYHWEASKAGATWVDDINSFVLTRSGTPVVRTFVPVYENP